MRRRERGGLGAGERRSRRRFGEREREAEHTGLEILRVLKGLIDGKDGRVVGNLPNRGEQLVFIFFELCFPCQRMIGLEIYRNTPQRVNSF